MGTAVPVSLSPAKVSGLFIYPVKSCRGISLSRAPLTPAGLRWDREWMVVNSKGRACTQRVEPKLALVEVEFPSEAFLEGWEPTSDSFMMLKAPGMQPLKVCLSKQHEVTDGVTVWEWTGSVWDEGAEASQWFSDFLGKPSQLVRFNTASEVRQVDPDYVKGHHPTLFSDGYPFLLTSQESLDALNELLEEPIPINRFRPNILVEGCEPFSEDIWTEIKIGRFSFLGSKLCARCKVPTINQETGIVGSEPTETLMRTRSGKVIRPNDRNKNKVYFGQNMVWNWNDSSARGSGKVLEVGDPVYVLRKVSSAAEAAA
ncbi:Pyruvate kinase-like, insert domain superfamily [Sesbania bispinosa]|nr:Pyruvate kinase-like, insert domain superfamily [Sesbania bispinosa]